MCKNDYYFFKDVSNESSGDKLTVFGQNDRYFIAIFLDSVKNRGKGIIKASFQQKKHIFDLIFYKIWLYFMDSLGLFKGLFIIIIRDFV